MRIQVREAGPADLPAVAHLFDLYRQFYGQPADAALALAFVSGRMTGRESVILMAQAADEGDIVGFCQMYPGFCSVEAARIYTLYDLFVLPAARKHGAGRLLLQAAEARAHADGMVRMDLTTARLNLPAQRLYESLGWERDRVFLAYNRRPMTPLSP